MCYDVYITCGIQIENQKSIFFFNNLTQNNIKNMSQITQ